MYTVPNQRIIKTNKAKCNSDNLYSPINIDAMSLMLRTLSGAGAIKLWLYLGKNKDQYEFALSRSEAMAFTGMSINTYTAAFDQLVRAGYLVKGESENYYNFFEFPQEDQKITVKINKG